MKTVLSVTAALCLVGTTVLFLTQGSSAQQDAARDVQPVNGAQGAQVGVLDEHTSGANIRASQLIGMNIENQRGDDVGEINDLVIDGNSGQVRYVAVTYGGFLGVGDKMFAVPFEAFKARRQAGDQDDYVLTLDVTQEQLKGAMGFDQENWPNFADRNFTSELDRRYGINRRISARDRDLNGTGRSGVDVDRDVDERR
jgi:sporulation protein YlmC with PRC-barrel domain